MAAAGPRPSAVSRTATTGHGPSEVPPAEGAAVPRPSAASPAAAAAAPLRELLPALSRHSRELLLPALARHSRELLPALARLSREKLRPALARLYREKLRPALARLSAPLGLRWRLSEATIYILVWAPTTKPAKQGH